MASSLVSTVLKKAIATTISTTLFTKILRPKTPLTAAISRRSISSSDSSTHHPSEEVIIETDMAGDEHKTVKTVDEHGYSTENTLNGDEMRAAMEAKKPYTYFLTIRHLGVVKSQDCFHNCLRKQ